MFDVFWNWVVYSSANPSQISSTIKYFSGTVITLITVVFGIGHINFPTEGLTAIVDSLIQAVQLTVVALTAIGGFVSLLRKLYLTIRGENIKVAPSTEVETPKNI